MACDQCRAERGATPRTDGLACNRENGEDRVGAENRANREDRANRGDRANRSPSRANPQLALSPVSSLSSLSHSSPTAIPLEIEQAIVATLPTGPRDYRALFRLARQLKGLLPHAELAEMREYVAEWHRRASTITAKSFLDAWGGFVQAWRRVRVPAGEGAIDTAFARASEGPPPEAATNLYGEGPIVLLAALCRELQRIVGEGEWFFLDCRTAGRLIRVEHTTAWRYLDVLCADGILAAGEKGSKETRKASRFRFIAPDERPT
jgi:hypothetical protein